jgi:hypothetical protein
MPKSLRTDEAKILVKLCKVEGNRMTVARLAQDLGGQWTPEKLCGGREAGRGQR